MLSYKKDIEIFPNCNHEEAGTILVLTAQKMKFSSTDFFSKCDKIRGFMGIWSSLLKKSEMENFFVCAVPPCSCYNEPSAIICKYTDVFILLFSSLGTIKLISISSPMGRQLKPCLHEKIFFHFQEKVILVFIIC